MTANHLYRRWLCWERDDQPREEAVWIEQIGAADAAEAFADAYYAQNASDIGQGPIAVSVEEEDGGVVTNFDVEIDFTPSFFAYEAVE